MAEQQVYIGLGSNLGDSRAILRYALEHIATIPHTSGLEVSSFYETPPISDIPQPNYINGVCRFKTNLEADVLFSHLQHIETLHGRTLQSEQPKNAPRRLDLDILFYGNGTYHAKGLEIPHPRWNQRLFVLIPLLDLTPTINVPNASGYTTVDIAGMIAAFPPGEKEQILPITEELSCIPFT